MPVAALSTIVLVLALAGCRSPEGPSADTADIEVDGRNLTIDIHDCGRDGDTVFMVGEGDGAVLQLVLETESAGRTDDDAPQRLAAASDGAGFSIVFEDGDALGAFGPGAAGRAGIPGGAVGRIDSVRIDGSRVRLTARAEVLDAADRGTGESAGRVSIDANCPDPADLEAQGSASASGATIRVTSIRAASIRLRHSSIRSAARFTLAASTSTST
jgi:hypothetical protein